MYLRKSIFMLNFVNSIRFFYYSSLYLIILHKNVVELYIVEFHSRLLFNAYREDLVC